MNLTNPFRKKIVNNLDDEARKKAHESKMARKKRDDELMELEHHMRLTESQARLAMARRKLKDAQEDLDDRHDLPISPEPLEPTATDRVLDIMHPILERHGDEIVKSLLHKYGAPPASVDVTDDLSPVQAKAVAAVRNMDDSQILTAFKMLGIKDGKKE